MGVRPVVAIFFAVCTALAAPAGEVRLLTESSTAFVGVPFTVAIEVAADKDHQPPQFPTVDAAEVTSAGQNSSTSSSIQIINGRRAVSQRTTTQYRYQIIPKEVGQLRIPAVPVEVDGQTLRTAATVIQVVKSETGDLMYVKLIGARDALYIGEPLDATLEIWIKPYSDGRLVLDENQMWSIINKEATEWGPFLDLVQERPPRINVRHDQRTADDGSRQTYYVYQLRKQIWPEKAGVLDLQSVRIVATYPLRIERDRGMFAILSDLRMTQSKPISATVEESAVRVKPVPTEGRPAYFRGAVGHYKLAASAKPTEVRVGDPITLNMVVSGDGRLDLLEAPALSEIPEFTRYFQVSEDQLAGVVENDGKRFTESIRAVSDEVTEIPPIPLAYFDPRKEEFVTVHSDPIPIQVKPAEQMSAAHIIESGDVGNAAVNNLTQWQRGIEANYTNPKDLLAVQGLHPGPVTAGVVVSPPVVYLVCLLIRRHRDRLTTDSAYARRRSARRQALDRASQAAALADPAAAAAQLAAALLGYIADRRNLPAGGLTPGEAVHCLRQAGVAEPLAREVGAVLQDSEVAAFGGLSAGSVADLHRRILACINELEKLRF